MFEFSSHYGWWKTHAGWAERRDQAMAERQRMIASYRKSVREHKDAMRANSRRSLFDRRREMRESLMISDHYSRRDLLQDDERHTRWHDWRIASAQARGASDELLDRMRADGKRGATFADYREQLVGYYESLLADTVDLDDALHALRDYEQLLADLAFEPDHTRSDYLDPRPDQEIEEERESLSLYAEALEDVSAGAFDLAMEDRLYGRPSGYTTFIREAVADGWCCVPDFTDAFDNPVMVASDRGLLAAIDAEDRAIVHGKVRDREAVQLWAKVREQRAWLQDLIADRDQADDTVEPGPMVTVQATVPELRQAWLQAKQADDTEAMGHIERWGKMLTA